MKININILEYTKCVFLTRNLGKKEMLADRKVIYIDSNKQTTYGLYVGNGRFVKMSQLYLYNDLNIFFRTLDLVYDKLTSSQGVFMYFLYIVFCFFFYLYHNRII